MEDESPRGAVHLLQAACQDREHYIVWDCLEEEEEEEEEEGGGDGGRRRGMKQGIRGKEEKREGEGGGRREVRGKGEEESDKEVRIGVWLERL
jgi:hypothetical protein